MEYLDSSHTGVEEYQQGGLLAWTIDKSAESKVKMLERERQAKTLDELFDADERNFAIPYSEITKVELEKKWNGTKLDIITNKKKHKWNVHGIIPEKSPNFPLHRSWKLEDYENMLRPVFGDKLSVKK
jgi:hypothetical protein